MTERASLILNPDNDIQVFARGLDRVSVCNLLVSFYDLMIDNVYILLLYFIIL